MAIAAVAWFARSRGPAHSDPPRASARSTELPIGAREPEVAAPAQAAPPPAYVPAAEAAADAGVELPWELEAIARRAREAASVEERTDALLELGLSDDPRVLEHLLGELARADASTRESLIAGVIQFGSRDAVPRLRALAEAAPDEDSRRALREAADYLALPSLSELRRGEVELDP